MEPITPCNPYAARPAGTAIFRNGLTTFKVYYVDIYGRAHPERYEWALCGRSQDTVIEHLERIDLEGVGCIVSFPHITKVFRFSPKAETIMHVCAYMTIDFCEIDLTREEGFMEFACYAEALIAAEEYHLWALATSVEAYLSKWVDWHDAPIHDHEKLMRYYAFA